MKSIFVLVKNNLKILIIKKPIYTLLMLVLPLIIFLVLPKILEGSSNNLKIAVVDYDKSFSSNAIKDFVSNNDVFQIVELESREEADKLFSSKDISLALIIDDNFEEKIFRGDNSAITLVGLEGETLYTSINEGISIEMSNLMYLAEINNNNIDLYKSSVRAKEDGKIDIVKKNLEDIRGEYNDSQTLIGFIIIFAFYRAMNGSALIGEDKEQNMYTRILVSSVKSWQYYLSNIISSTILLIITFTLCVMEIDFFTNINMGISSLQLIIILTLISIVAVSLGTFCMTVTDDRDLSSILSNIFIISFLALGGCFVPLIYLSPFINKLSYFVPTRWAMEAITNIQEGTGGFIVIIDCIILSLFAAILFGISIYCINKRDKVDNVR